MTTDNDALFAAPPAIDPLTGTLTYTPAPGASGSARVTARLADDGGVADGGADTSAPAVFTVAVGPVGNRAPTDLTAGPLAVLENSPGGTAAGTLAVADPDAGDAFSFAVSDPRFAVVGGTLTVVAGALLDHEAEPTVTLTVTATDGGGLSVARPFTVAIRDVNEAPTAVALGGLTLADGVAGAAVGPVSGTDPDAGDALTFSVVNDARFEVAGGAVRLRGGVAVRFADAARLVLDVRATDSGGLALTRSFVVAVAPPAPAALDVSAQVRVTYSATRSSRSAHTVSFDATVTNVSGTPLRAPLRLAWAGLSPASLAAVGADGTLAGGVPYFDFGGLLGPDGVLSPGETTAARTLTLANPDDARPSFVTATYAAPAAVPPPPDVRVILDFDGGALPGRAGLEVVPGSAGRVHPAFAAYGGADREAQIQGVVDAVRADFAGYPVLVLRDDAWPANPLFGVRDTAVQVGGDGAWLVGPNPAAGYAGFDPGNAVADVGFAFSGATAAALAALGRPAAEFVRSVANTVSHEVGHTFGLDDATALHGTADLMGLYAAPGVAADGQFSSAVLPRAGGGAYSSDGYLRSLFGLSSAPLPAQIGGTFKPQALAGGASRPAPAGWPDDDPTAPIDVG